MRVSLQNWLLAMSYGLIAGLIITLSKINLKYIPAVCISFISTFLAIGTLVPMISVEDFKKISVKYLVYFFILGISGIYFSNVWYFKSVQHTTVINAALINALCPLVTLITTATLRQKLPRKKLILAMILSFIGICCIITQGKIPDINKVSYVGELYAFGAVVAWVFYGVFIARLNTTFSSTFITFGANCAGALCLLPAIISSGYSLESIEPYQWFTLIFIGILGSGIGYALYNYSLQNIGPNMTTLTVFGIKAISVFVIAFLLLDDPITVWDMTGAGAILSGLSLALW